MDSERTLVIDIHLSRGLAVTLAVFLATVIWAGYLFLRPPQAAASNPQEVEASLGPRQYYLSKTSRNGSAPDGACASGYHMASFWEIVEPASLKYNTTLGLLQSDSGFGPPTGIWGWVQTGNVSFGAESTPGKGNCSTWSSSNSAYCGTTVALPTNWTVSTGFYIWDVTTIECNAYRYTWCVEN
jgi:hypothetical protein